MLIYPTLYKNECEKQTMSLFSHNAKNDENGFRLSIDIPGVKQEDINIKIDERSLHVSGFRKVHGHNSNFEKIFTLPRRVNVEKLQANLSNGVLLITAPKQLINKTTRTITVTNNPHEEEKDIEMKENGEVSSSNAVETVPVQEEK